MSLKCHDCGHVFEWGEEEVFVERHGLDCPPYEATSLCPKCKSDDFEVLSPCKKCKEEFFDEDLLFGICPDCVEKYIDFYKNDVLHCYEFAENDTAKIEINGFLAQMFSESQINEILLSFLLEKQKEKKIDCLPYIQEDVPGFIEAIEWSERNEHKKES